MYDGGPLRYKPPRDHDPFVGKIKTTKSTKSKSTEDKKNRSEKRRQEKPQRKQKTLTTPRRARCLRAWQTALSRTVASSRVPIPEPLPGPQPPVALFFLPARADGSFPPPVSPPARSGR